MILSRGQRAAINELLPIAQIALELDKSDLPIKPRTHSLMCAPSGSGKSYIMKALGEILNVAVLHINVSSWAVLNCKGGQSTWDTIVKFISEYPKGIIVLDEIDKINSTEGDWIGHIRLEIYDLLDGRIPTEVDTDNLDTESELW